MEHSGYWLGDGLSWMTQDCGRTYKPWDSAVSMSRAFQEKTRVLVAHTILHVMNKIIVDNKKPR